MNDKYQVSDKIKQSPVTAMSELVRIVLNQLVSNASPGLFDIDIFLAS